jgi:hypothetical protein
MRVRSSCTVSSRIGSLAARSATPRVGTPPDQKNASIAPSRSATTAASSPM